MKILQLIYESAGSPFGFGGAGVRAYEIYRRLSDRHDITLLCMRYPGARDGMRNGLRHVFAGIESSNLVKSVFSYSLRASLHVMRHGRDYDVIVENFLPSTPFCARFLTTTPVVLQIQDFWGRHTFKRYPLLYALPMFVVEKFYPRLYNKHIYVSDVTKERFHSSSAFPVIPNGVDEELFLPAAGGERHVLFMSSIDLYKKGLDLLLGAFAGLSGDGGCVPLVIAGAGRDLDNLRSAAEKLPDGTKDRIRIPGWLSGADKTAALRDALFVVLPSRHEAQPISLLEAAACGKPCIVSDIPELSFVERGGFGVTFPCGSREGLLEMMRLLLSDAGLRRKMGQRGREYARSYRWDSVALQFENTLKNIA
ncbi:MAG TPA: glycosyltransferase family 4 protein [Dissulfurispiraceae bacterium]|nr:glycosyltransferase family 4 protein [Dissulfurispiraceae bacterium]